MGLNIMGEDSRVERGGQDGRSSSGYSQEQPCKRSKDGEEGRGGQQKGAEGEERMYWVKRWWWGGLVHEKGPSYCTNT